LGSPIPKVYKLNKRSKDPKIQRSKAPKNLDLGQNFSGSGASKDLLSKPKHTTSIELYPAPQQNFTELCRSPVSNIPQGSDHHAFCMKISC